MICYGHIVFQWLNFHAGSSLDSVCKAVCVFHVCSCFISNNIIEYKCFVPRGETGIDRVQMETQYLSVISRRYFNLCLDATFLCLFTLIEQTVQLNWIHCHTYHHLYWIGLFVFTRCTLLSHKLPSDTHNPLPDLKTLYSNLKLIYNEYKLTGIHKKTTENIRFSSSYNWFNVSDTIKLRISLFAFLDTFCIPFWAPSMIYLGTIHVIFSSRIQE